MSTRTERREAAKAAKKARKKREKAARNTDSNEDVFYKFRKNRNEASFTSMGLDENLVRKLSHLGFHSHGDVGSVSDMILIMNSLTDCETDVFLDAMHTTLLDSVKLIPTIEMIIQDFSEEDSPSREEILSCADCRLKVQATIYGNSEIPDCIVCGGVLSKSNTRIKLRTTS